MSEADMMCCGGGDVKVRHPPWMDLVGYWIWYFTVDRMRDVCIPS